jgi:hypothetical protein
VGGLSGAGLTSAKIMTGESPDRVIIPLSTDQLLRTCGIVDADTLERMLEAIYGMLLIVTVEFERRFPDEYREWDKRK